MMGEGKVTAIVKKVVKVVLVVVTIVQRIPEVLERKQLSVMKMLISAIFVVLQDLGQLYRAAASDVDD